MSSAASSSPEALQSENRQLREQIAELEAELAAARTRLATEQTKVEQDLREAQTALTRQVAEFEALFRAIPVGVGVSHDPECREIQVNPALARMLGVPEAGNASKTGPAPEHLPFRIVRDGQEIPSDQLPMQIAARTGEEVRDFFYEIVRNDGVTLTEYGHATPLFDKSGAVIGSIGVFLDFTDLRKAQQKLEQANAELRRSNADLNHFAYAASHDLREPLRAIRLYAQLLSRNTTLQPFTDVQECLTVISESAVRMDRLLGDLMNYVQVATDPRPATKPVDLNAVLDTVRLNLQVAIEESSALVRADRMPELVGQQNDFVQLFQNLIGNAIKYRSDAPPLVQISVAQSDGCWQFRVSDNGVGIEPVYANRVFDLFHRLHGREVPGSGVGLAICKRVVQRYGGQIWVESARGEGSCFCFTIPLEPRPPLA